MDSDLQGIREALEALTDTEIAALINVANRTPGTARDMLNWISAACVWEMNRRHRIDYNLLPPANTIPPEERAASIDAAFAVRGAFLAAERPNSAGVLAFFDALAVMLSASKSSQ